MIVIPKFLSVVISTLVCSTLLVGCGHSNVTQPAQQPQPVGVLTVQPQNVELEAELSGRTSASTVAEIRPQVSGVVLQRLFTEGSDVKAGQALYRIDPATYRASFESAQANLAALRLKAERYKRLIAINAVGQQDYDDVVSALKQAEAVTSSARINLNYSHVISPVSGRIGKSTVTAGALVTANQSDALATVQQLDPIYVDVTRSNGEVLQLKHDLSSGAIKRTRSLAARVKLTLEDGSAYPFEGSLVFSDVTVDQRTGMVTLRALFPNPKHDLLPGMYVRAHLVEGENDKAILVPQDAISHDSKGQAVAMVVSRAGKAELRVVQTPRSVGNNWLVSSGLNPGDQLIIRGLQFVRSGVPVRPMPMQTSLASGLGE